MLSSPKRKFIPTGSELDAVPSSEFNNSDWLANHINQKASTVTNISRDESKDGLQLTSDILFANSDRLGIFLND